MYASAASKSRRSSVLNAGLILLALIAAPFCTSAAYADTATVSYLMPWSPNGDLEFNSGSCNNSLNYSAAEGCYDSAAMTWGANNHETYVLKGWVKSISTGPSGAYFYSEQVCFSTGGCFANITIGPVTACPLGGGPGYLHNDSSFATTYADFCMIQGQAPQNGSCGSQPQDSATGQCYAPADKNAGPSCPCVGNPINPGSGNKYEIVTDFKGGGPFPLVFRRTYNSGIANEGGGTTGADQSLGAGWTNDAAAHLSVYLQQQTYFTCTDNTNTQYICPTITGDALGSVTLWHGDGSQEVFTGEFNYNGALDSVLTDEQGSHGQLRYASGVYTYQRTDGYKEQYNAAGRLTAVVNIHGLSQTYTYTFATVGTQTVVSTITVTDPNGRQMVITYDTTSGSPTLGLILTVTVPSQAVSSATTPATITYGYDNATRNLTSVTYKDTNVNPVYQTTVNYEYNAGSAFPHALTGLMDENQTEYSAWSYDNQGRAICSEHAPSSPSTCINEIAGAGVDRTVVHYNGDGSGCAYDACVTEATGVVRNMMFQDVNGRYLLSSVDRRCPECGDTAQSVSYDSNGHVQSITDFDGNITTYNIDIDGVELSRTEASNDASNSYKRTIDTTPYSFGGVETGLPKTVKEYGYDPSGNRILMRETDYCYNYTGTAGNCSTDSTGFGATWTTTVSDPIVHAAPNNTLPARITTYAYIGGRLQSLDGPFSPSAPNTDKTTYKHKGDVGVTCTGTQNAGDTCEIDYPALPSGYKSLVTLYSAAGFPMSVQDVNGVVTALGYDPRGRLASRTLDSTGSFSATTSYTYDPAGQLKTVVLPTTASGHAYETYSYDHAHRLTGVLNDALESRSYAYSYLSGNRFQVEEQRFTSGGTLKYDNVTTRNDGAPNIDPTLSLDQTQVQDGAGDITTYTRDPNGNVTMVTDPMGRVSRRYVDSLNRLAQTKDPYGNPTSYVLDALDHLTEVTSPRGAQTSYVIDAFGEVLSQVSPDTGTTSYDYSNWVSGNVFTVTDAVAAAQTPTGPIQTYKYDGLMRLQSQTNSLRSITYTYDSTTLSNGIGRLTGIGDISGSTNYSYDSHGNISRKLININAGSLTHTALYTYDTSDNLIQIQFPPSAGTINYLRNDALDRVTEVDTTYTGGPTERIAYGIGYLPFGPINGLTYGNLLQETRSYDLAYRLTNIGTPGAQNLTYAYNQDDTVQSITDGLNGANTQNFTYDALQRIIHATGPYPTVSVGADYVNHPETSYDPDGNRSQMTVGSVTTTYTYNHGAPGVINSILDHTVTGSTTINYQYDADGSTTNDGTYCYKYDVLERNTKVTDGSCTGSGATEYSAAYNGLGQRVSKTVGTNNYGFMYDEQGHLAVELNPDNSILRQHIWLGDRPIAYFTRNIVGSTSADVKYLHVDLLDTPREMTTSTKAVSWSWNPDPWGNNSTTQPSNYNSRFPGQYADGQTGNMQNWMRDYDPQTGRYLQSDPIGLEGGINAYIYVLNNPISLRDFSGLSPGDMPPPPPGYDPQTWTSGQWPNGKPWIRNPNGDTYTSHCEDTGHWRHWDIRGAKGGDKGTWPNNPNKPWPGQKGLKPTQSPVDPSGDTPPWTPPGYTDENLQPRTASGAPEEPGVPEVPEDPEPFIPPG